LVSDTHIVQFASVQHPVDWIVRITFVAAFRACSDVIPQMPPESRVSLGDPRDGSDDRLAYRNPGALPTCSRGPTASADPSGGPELLQQGLTFIGQPFSSSEISSGGCVLDLLLEFDKSITVPLTGLVIEEF
jgi:hypothetical protein